MQFLIALILFFYKAAVKRDIESLMDRYDTDGLTSESIEQLFHQRVLLPSDTPDVAQIQDQQSKRQTGNRDSKSVIKESIIAINAIKKFKNKLSEYYDAISIFHVVGRNEADFNLFNTIVLY